MKNREYENMKDIAVKAIILTAIVVMIIVADTIGWFYLTEVKGYCDYIGEWAASIMLVGCFNIWMVVMLIDYIKRQMKMKTKRQKKAVRPKNFSDTEREMLVNEWSTL